jgi:2-polyprenyl-3-methyl-5-hydroxy-6-metoxy-1,4-benzoquinol methylase
MSNLERLNKCPLCKSGLFLNLGEVTDHSISGQKFLLSKCSKCHLVFTNPRPDETSIQEYYVSESYVSHQDKSNNLTNFLYKIIRKVTIRHKLNWLNTFNSKKGNLLDIGCGTGYLLEAAARDGWKGIGIEPDPTARKLANSKNLEVESEISKVYKKEHYQCITMFHVLEHVHQLRKLGKKLSKMLKTEGTLLIAVPNLNSFDSNYYKADWAGLDVPRHLYHFTKDTIQYFAKDNGFLITDTIPMKFDSFYVSLLSETYRNKNNKMWEHYKNGFITGLKSNRWAKKNELNYSSILFILKKS